MLKMKRPGVERELNEQKMAFEGVITKLSYRETFSASRSPQSFFTAGTQATSRPSAGGQDCIRGAGDK